MSLLLILIILLLVLGGGGFYAGGPRFGGGLVGIILIILIVLALPDGCSVLLRAPDAADYRICRIRCSSTAFTRSSRPTFSRSVTSGCSGGSYCELESLGVLRYVSRNGMSGPSSTSIVRRARSRSAPRRRREADDAD